MKKHLSPKQVARAIDVSESSLKRWCDQGLIATVRTAGGHRRLPVSAVVEFLRASGKTAARPELLGLPTTSGRGAKDLEQAVEQLVGGLIAGNEPLCHRIVIDLFLAGQSIASIGDQVISPAFDAVGDQWECGEAEIYQERRGCEIMRRALGELAQLIPDSSDDAPIAVGGAAWGDQYQLPTTLVELELRSRGWRATSLGANLPPETLVAAVDHYRPALFWLSVSYVDSVDAFTSAFRDFSETIADRTRLVVGGRALPAALHESVASSIYCERLRDLEPIIANRSAIEG